MVDSTVCKFTKTLIYDDPLFVIMLHNARSCRCRRILDLAFGTFGTRE